MSYPLQRRVSLVIDDHPTTARSNAETAQSKSCNQAQPRGSVPMTCSLVYIKKKPIPEYTAISEEDEDEMVAMDKPTFERASTYPYLTPTKLQGTNLVNNDEVLQISNRLSQYSIHDKTSACSADNSFNSMYADPTSNESFNNLSYNSTEDDSEKDSLFDQAVNPSPITEAFGNYDPFKIIDTKIQTDRRKSVDWFNKEIEQQLSRQSSVKANESNETIQEVPNDDNINVHHFNHHHHCSREAGFAPADKPHPNHNLLPPYQHQSNTNANTDTQTSLPEPRPQAQSQHQGKRRDRHRRRLTCAVIFKSPRVVEI